MILLVGSVLDKCSMPEALDQDGRIGFLFGFNRLKPIF